MIIKSHHKDFYAIATENYKIENRNNYRYYVSKSVEVMIACNPRCIKVCATVAEMCVGCNT